MRQLMMILSLTFITAAAVMAQAPTNRAATEKEIATKERAINDAVAKGDMKSFHEIVASDAIGVDGGGISKVNAPDFDKMMQNVKLQSWNMDGSQFYWVNDATVVHIYRWIGKGTFQGQPIPSPVWTSTVWTNRGGKWTATFHQETTAMTPPPSDTKPASGKK